MQAIVSALQTIYIAHRVRGEQSILTWGISYMTELQIFTISPVFQTIAGSAKSYAKPTNKYPAKKSTGPTDSDRTPP